MKMKENLSIEDKKMLRSVFWRSWTMNASRTGATQYHAVGVIYTLLPVINRFYKTKEERSEALVNIFIPPLSYNFCIKFAPTEYPL